MTHDAGTDGDQKHRVRIEAKRQCPRPLFTYASRTPGQKRFYRLDSTRSPGAYRLVLASGERDSSGYPIDEEASDNALFRAKWP
jgi:hypothetical protein